MTRSFLQGSFTAVQSAARQKNGGNDDKVSHKRKHKGKKDGDKKDQKDDDAHGNKSQMAQKEVQDPQAERFCFFLGLF